MLLVIFGSDGMACDQKTLATVASPDEIRAFFQAQGKKVVTFIGYSNLGYEDPEAMTRIAKRILSELNRADDSQYRRGALGYRRRLRNRESDGIHHHGYRVDPGQEI